MDLQNSNKYQKNIIVYVRSVSLFANVLTLQCHCFGNVLSPPSFRVYTSRYTLLLYYVLRQNIELLITLYGIGTNDLQESLKSSNDVFRS